MLPEASVGSDLAIGQSVSAGPSLPGQVHDFRGLPADAFYCRRDARSDSVGNGAQRVVGKVRITFGGAGLLVS